MSAETRVLHNFTQTCLFLGIDKDRIAGAKEAVADVFQEAKAFLQISSILSGFFPSHGEEHVVRLAELCYKFITDASSLNPKCKDVDFLVLLFTSFIWHDIGMGTSKKTEDEDIWDFLKEHRSHAKHHKRSLELIEQHLNPTVSGVLPSWVAFWDKSANGLTDKDALIMLLRICQSHGDSEKDFLEIVSMQEYTRTAATSLTNIFDFDETGKLNFEKFFRYKDYFLIKHMIWAASGILCLCDLSDIGINRFNVPTTQDLDKWLGDKPQNRREFFYHLAGHKLGHVDFFEDKTILHLSPPRSNVQKLLLMCMNKGPGGDLLYWANHKRLVLALHEYVSSNYKGAFVYLDREDDAAWGELETIMALNIGKTVWPLATPTTITRDAIASQLMYNWALPHNSENQFVELKQTSPTIAILHDFARQGLTYDFLFNSLTDAELLLFEHTHCVALIMDSPDIHDPFLASTVIATKLSEEILSRLKMKD